MEVVYEGSLLDRREQQGYRRRRDNTFLKRSRRSRISIVFHKSAINPKRDIEQATPKQYIPWSKNTHILSLPTSFSSRVRGEVLDAFLFERIRDQRLRILWSSLLQRLKGEMLLSRHIEICVCKILVAPAKRIDSLVGCRFNTFIKKSLRQKYL